MSADFHFKLIADPVHGSIGVSNLEAEVISTRVFQRLHNVRQLGLAHLVFPGANYSRFAHSVGACHNAGQLIESIKRNKRISVKENVCQAVRLAALLHDLGHYPFSHAMEHVVKDHYSEQMFEDKGSNTKKSGKNTKLKGLAKGSEPPSYDHEHLGRKILELDLELREILKRYGFEINEIKAIFSKEHPDPFIGIISSDLDCDRLDYLRRTAHHSGLPYGTVDIDYIVSQATLDSEKVFCFKSKALRAADHLLISRYFDYLQVPFHKMVVSLEWALTSSIQRLISSGTIDCSAEEVRHSIEIGKWSEFDDHYLLSLFKFSRNQLSKKTDEESRLSLSHLSAVLDRRPVKLLAGWENIIHRDSTAHFEAVRQIRVFVEDFSKKHGINSRRFFLWDRSLTLTKVGSKFHSKGNWGSDSSYIDIADSVQILDSKEKTAKPILNYKNTLVSVLSERALSIVRVYAIFPGDSKAQQHLRDRFYTELEKRGMPAQFP